MVGPSLATQALIAAGAFPCPPGRNSGLDRPTGRKHVGSGLPGTFAAGETADAEPGGSTRGLPAPGIAVRGYGVRMPHTGTLLDPRPRAFLPVRDGALDGLNPCETEPPLAIVPASFDQRLGRHVLIYGVLPTAP